MNLSESTGQADSRYCPLTIETVTNVNVETIEILNQALVITIELWTQLQCAHWTIQGIQVFAQHQRFSTLVKQFDTYADFIAERIVALGGVASGSLQVAPQPSRIYLYRCDQFNSGQEYIVELADRLTTYSLSLRNYREITHSLGDVDTANLYTEILGNLDSTLWLLETHLKH